MTGLVLVGPRGAGKSVVGQALAGRLGWAFVDTDALVESDGQTVAEVFAAEGEAGFRAREEAAVCGLRPAAPTVVATGGGAVLSEASRAHLKTLGPVVFLTAEPAQLASRIAGSDRPPLTDAGPEAEVRQVLAAREPVYRAVADRVVDTSARDVASVVALLYDYVTGVQKAP